MLRLPVEAVRDLLGIARAMYAAKKSEGAPTPVPKELTEIGRKLNLALDMGRRLPPDSMGHRAAIQHAEEATKRLTALITHETPLAPAVEAAVVRVRRREPMPSKSDARKTGFRR